MCQALESFGSFVSAKAAIGDNDRATEARAAINFLN
jgi:hypothetical protein